MKKRLLTFEIVCMFLIATITTFLVIDVQAAGGNTVYVDDDAAPSWYDATHVKTIQEGINNASIGDTVYVYNGTYYENVVINKQIDLIGEDINETIIDGGENDDVVYITADEVNITGFTITNSSNSGEAGICLDDACNNRIFNNIINDNSYGVSLKDVSKNNTISQNYIGLNDAPGIYLSTESINTTIFNNFVSENGNGIAVDSSYNIIYNNTIESSNARGLSLYGSYTTIKNNSFVDDGLWVFDSFNNIVENNSVNGKALVYLEKETNKVIDGDVGQVILVSCEYIMVRNLHIDNIGSISPGIELYDTHNSSMVNITVSGCAQGIVLLFSDNNTICDSHLSSTGKSTNEPGIYLLVSNYSMVLDNVIVDYYVGIYDEGSCRNQIEDNTVSNCEVGLGIAAFNNTIDGNLVKQSSLYGVAIIGFSNIIIENTIRNNCGTGLWLHGTSMNNTIYHNNFIENTVHAYDESNEVNNNSWESIFDEGNYWDNYTGIDADKDGIGDTPYNISGGDNKDYYPLMQPFGSVELSINIAPFDLGKISAFIRNIGDFVVSNVEWSISVKGGIFKLINISANGTIDTIDSDMSEKVTTGFNSIARRLGTVTIDVELKAGPYSFNEKFYGFVIGRLFVDRTYQKLNS